jgi:uncharacterized damage-inducible protein DinB
MHINSVKHTLVELKEVLNQLSDEDFTRPIKNLGDSSIGGHSRHIIELFQCLLSSYDCEFLNYDNRERNSDIQTNIKFANNAIDVIIEAIDKPNKKLTIEQNIDGELFTIDTNYHRELLYNLEHCIHHQALIKVALYEIGNVEINESFGVVPSTMEYKKRCAQ